MLQYVVDNIVLSYLIHSSVSVSVVSFRVAGTYHQSFKPWQLIQTRGVNWSQNKSAAAAVVKAEVEPAQIMPVPSNHITNNNGYAQDLRRFLEEVIFWSDGPANCSLQEASSIEKCLFITL